jgi:hypothetical protein
LIYSLEKNGSKRISTCWFGDAFRGGWTGSDGAPERRNEPGKTGLGNHQTGAFYQNSSRSRRISGGRDRDRTCDPYHVKVVLYR